MTTAGFTFGGRSLAVRVGPSAKRWGAEFADVKPPPAARTWRVPLAGVRHFEDDGPASCAAEGEYMAMSVERTKALRKTRAPRTSEIHDWRERAESPRDCGARLRRRSKRRPRSAGESRQSLHHRLLAASIGQCNGVTTCNAVSVTVSPPMQRRFSRPENSIGAVRPSRACGQVRDHPAAVRDCDLELVALKEIPVFAATA